MNDAYCAFLANAGPRTLELAKTYALRFGPTNAREMIGLRRDMMSYCEQLCGMLTLDQIADCMTKAMKKTKQRMFDAEGDTPTVETTASACDLVLADVLEDIAAIADVTTPAVRP